MFRDPADLANGEPVDGCGIYDPETGRGRAERLRRAALWLRCSSSPRSNSREHDAVIRRRAF